MENKMASLSENTLKRILKDMENIYKFRDILPIPLVS